MIPRRLHTLPGLSLAALLAGCGLPPAGAPSKPAEPPGTAPAAVESGGALSVAPQPPPRARGGAPAARLEPPLPRSSSPRRAASVSLTEKARKRLRSGQYTLALMELEKSLSLDGSNPYAHYYLALSHYRLRNFEASLEFVDAAATLLGHSRPWLARSWVLRGDNLRALGRFGPAGAAYRKALSLDPDNPSAQRGLGHARRRSKVLSW